jgi:type I restriction enzyme S subunit
MKLADIVEMTFGFAFKSAEFSDDPSDIRLLRGDNVAQGRLRWDGAKRFSSARLNEAKKYELVPGDVVIAMDRPWIGAGLKYSVVRDADLPSLLVQRVARLRAKDDRLEQGFLAAVIGGKAFTDYVIGVQTGSAVPHISGGQIGAFEFDLPDIATQRAIASMLGTLDEKLESSRRLTALIPPLVRAQVAAAMSRRSSAGTVASLARFTNGGAYTKGASGTGRMVLRIAELNSGPGGSTVYSDIAVPDDKIARAGDILMSWSGSLDVYRWFRDDAIVNQHIFKVTPTGYPSWLVFDRLDAVMPVFQRIAQDKATTMGHIQRGHLESTTIELPAPEDIERLDSTLGPLWERLLLAERENVTLEALRDALLPGLLSGRVRVGEAAEVLV